PPIAVPALVLMTVSVPPADETRRVVAPVTMRDVEDRSRNRPHVHDHERPPIRARAIPVVPAIHVPETAVTEAIAIALSLAYDVDLSLGLVVTRWRSAVVDIGRWGRVADSDLESEVGARVSGGRRRGDHQQRDTQCDAFHGALLA